MTTSPRDNSNPFEDPTLWGRLWDPEKGGPELERLRSDEAGALRVLHTLLVAKQRWPEASPVRRALALVLLALERPAEALEHLQALDPQALREEALVVLRAEALSRLRRPREAFDVLEQHEWSAATAPAREEAARLLREVARFSPPERAEHLRARLEPTVSSNARGAPWGAPRSSSELGVPGARELVGCARAGALGSVHERAELLDRVLDALLRRYKPSVLLVGPPGVGKTALVEALALRVARGAVPAGARIDALYDVPLAALVAGARNRGDLEQRVLGLLEALQARPGAVLFFDELHTAFGGAAETDVAELLKPALARGELRLLGATTPAEFSRSVGRDPALLRRLTVLEVGEPSGAELDALLSSAAASLSAHHGVALEEKLWREALRRSEVLVGRYLPDRALELLDLAAVRARRRASAQVELGDVLDALSALSRGGPDRAPLGTQLERWHQLGDSLAGQLLGQGEASRRWVRGLAARELGAASRGARPRSVSLLLGPSSCGRGTAARQLAAGLGLRFRTLELGAFREAQDRARLLGVPVGYTGHEQPGALQRVLRDTPEAVLLLRGLRGAHPEVLEAIAELCAEGTLTDAHGDPLDARGLRVVLLAEEQPAASVGFSAAGAAREEEVWAELRHSLGARLLQSADVRVRFAPLAEAERRALLAAKLEERASQLTALGLALRVEDDVLPWLASLPASGARASLEQLERHLFAPLFGRLLEEPSPPLSWRASLREGSLALEAAP